MTAGPLVEERLEVAVGADRAADGLPDILLLAGAAVRAVHELHLVALLRGLADLAVDLAAS